MPMFNYLVFPDDGGSHVVEFSDHRVSKRTITDPESGRPKEADTLIFQLKSVDGQAASGEYSVLGVKEYMDWLPWLDSKRYAGRRFRITKQGRGFQRRTTIEAL